MCRCRAAEAPASAVPGAFLCHGLVSLRSLHLARLTFARQGASAAALSWLIHQTSDVMVTRRPLWADRLNEPAARRRGGLWRGPPAIHGAHKPAGELARIPMAGALLVVPTGRAVPAGGSPLCGTESGTSRSCAATLGVSLVQCRGPRQEQGRPAGESKADAGSGDELARVPQRRTGQYRR